MVRKIVASIGCLLWCSVPAFAQPDWRVYYPLQVKHRWTYVASDPKAAPDPKQKDSDPQKQLVVEVEGVQDYTRKVTNKGKESDEKLAGYILKMTSGNKVERDQVVVMNEGVHRFNVNGTAINPPILILKFGLKNAGETWDWDSTSGNATLKGTCTIGAGPVQVPYKDHAKLDAITVTFCNNKTGADRQEIVTWYVANVGRVKQHIKAGNHEVIQELVEFTPAK